MQCVLSIIQFPEADLLSVYLLSTSVSLETEYNADRVINYTILRGCSSQCTCYKQVFLQKMNTMQCVLSIIQFSEADLLSVYVL